jgi:tripartite-type tricarboxylate transporter receptor subunit TctC
MRQFKQLYAVTQRSKVWALATAMTLAAAAMTPAAAAGYPDRPVKVIVPYSAGGGTDTVARAIASRLSEKWGQTVIVENRAGAGTAIGGEAAAKAPADGYTLLFSDSSTFVINPHVYTHLPYKPLQDFEPVSLVVRLAPVMAISTNTPAKTLPELIAYMKANPGKLSYASPGIGTYTHISMEYFKHEAGVDMLHIPYKGSSPAMTDLLAGRVNAYFVTYSVFDANDKAGKLKIIASATPKRLSIRPDLPTIAETLPGFRIDVWFGMAAPKGTPTAVLDKIHNDIAEIEKDPVFIEKFIKPQAYVVGDLSRAQFGDQMKSDFAKWQKLVAIAKVKIDR